MQTLASDDGAICWLVELVRVHATPPLRDIRDTVSSEGSGEYANTAELAGWMASAGCVPEAWRARAALVCLIWKSPEYVRRKGRKRL